MILPYGGKLVERISDEPGFDDGSLKRINLDSRRLSDFEMIATGGLSPLEGFMTKKDYESVRDEMRLASGLPWTIPITLDITDAEASEIKEGDTVVLTYRKEAGAQGQDDTTSGNTVGETDKSKEMIAGIIQVEEKYHYDKRKEALCVYGTDDTAHPAVERILKQQGNVLIGGKITALKSFIRDVYERDDFRKKYRLTPARTRDLFAKLGWQRVVGFQTRNPIHRAHEYLIKCALEISDGVFIHPIAGDTKKDDVPLDVRMRCYEALIEGYFPRSRVLLALNPASMRYGGPREAVFHAIVRRNYGCTHFIVGRDHAGVGNYYGPYDAQKIFERFSIKEEIGIEPLFFENSFWCFKCGGMASLKTCPHPSEEHLSLSGTKLRAMLSSDNNEDKNLPPEEFTRKEVAKILVDYYNNRRENTGR